MIEIPRSPNYHQNMERAGDLLTCVVCGRGIKASNPKMVHVHNGGTHLVTEDEAATLDPAADLCFYPIGNDCLQRHPELKPYVSPVMPIARLDEDPTDYISPEACRANNI